MYVWKDRELVMDILERLTGNRVNYGMNIIGGVRRDIDAAQTEEVLKALDVLEERTSYYIKVCTEEQSIIARPERRGQAPPRGSASPWRGRPGAARLGRQTRRA